MDEWYWHNDSMKNELMLKHTGCVGNLAGAHAIINERTFEVSFSLMCDVAFHWLYRGLYYDSVEDAKQDIDNLFGIV